MYVTEKYRQGLFTTICSPHQPTRDWCSLLWYIVCSSNNSGSALSYWWPL